MGSQDRPESSTRYHPGTTTTSALSRYPSIGQFEEQRWLGSRTNSAITSNVPDAGWIFPPQKSKKTDVYKKPSVEDIADGAIREQPATSNLNPDPKKLSRWSPLPLPGAWPEPNTDYWVPITNYRGHPVTPSTVGSVVPSTSIQEHKSSSVSHQASHGRR